MADRAGAMDVAMPVHVRVQHPRPDLATAFVLPRTDSERTIAQIWHDLLGITEVGIHDSFFELGGDSLGHENSCRSARCCRDGVMGT